MGAVTVALHDGDLHEFVYVGPGQLVRGADFDAAAGLAPDRASGCLAIDPAIPAPNPRTDDVIENAGEVDVPRGQDDHLGVVITVAPDPPVQLRGADA